MYFVDIDNQVDEGPDGEGGSESKCVSTDNVGCLSLFDAGNQHAPEVASVNLDDGFTHTRADNEIWGRFISGVFGAGSDIHVQLADGDGQNTIHGTYLVKPFTFGTRVINDKERLVFGDELVQSDFEFFRLQEPESGSHYFRFTPVDHWGLRGEPIERRIHVIDRPGWIDDATFDPISKSYTLSWKDAILDFDASLDIPLLGKLENRAFVGGSLSVNAGLDPSVAPTVDARAELEVVLLGQEVFRESFKSGETKELPGNFEFTVKPHIDAISLGLAGLDFQIDVNPDIELFNVRTPQIPLVAFGVPGLAEISANVQFGLAAFLDASITVGITEEVIGLRPGSGATLTFTPDATLSGDVKVVGVKLASLGGTLSLPFHLSATLSGSPDQLVPFDEIGPEDLDGCVDVDMQARLFAEILGFDVWSWDAPNIDLFELPNGCGERPSFGAFSSLEDDEQPTIVGGNEVPDGVGVEPRPNLLIDAETGEAIFLQVQNAGTASQPIGNLAWDYRMNSESQYSGSLTPLPGSNHVTRPILVERNGDNGFSAIAIYEAAKTPGTVDGRTRNQLYDDQELRYRTYANGTWSNESSFTNNSIGDGMAAASFNGDGYGIVAWTQTSAASPISTDGYLNSSSNDIRVIFYDVDNDEWILESVLSDDAEGATHADSQPSVHFADDGRAYVVWLRDDGDPTTRDNTKLMTRVFSDGTWSPVFELSTDRLPEGTIEQLAIGSRGDHGPGGELIDVIFAMSEPDPRDDNGDLLPGETHDRHTWLFSRVTRQDDFDSSIGPEVIDSGGQFSHVRTLQHPDGGLFVYWQGNDGVESDIYAAFAEEGTMTNGWSDPARLTTGTDFEFHPTVAFDRPVGEGFASFNAFDDGNALQTAYFQVAPDAGATTPSNDAAIGTGGARVGTSNMPYLPETSFSQPLTLTNYAAPNGISPPLPAGQPAEAAATITNRGLRADEFEIRYMAGPDGDERRFWTFSTSTWNRISRTKRSSTSPLSPARASST